MKPVRLLPAADRDLDRIAAFYVEQSGIDLGLRFYEAAAQSFDRLAEFPESSPRVESANPAIDGWRVTSIDPPFSRIQAFYLIEPTTVEILRVVHGARDLDGLLEILGRPSTGG